MKLKKKKKLLHRIKSHKNFYTDLIVVELFPFFFFFVFLDNIRSLLKIEEDKSGWRLDGDDGVDDDDDRKYNRRIQPFILFIFFFVLDIVHLYITWY